MSYSKIPAGKDVPNDIYVAIEIPANHAPIKYEIDKDSDCLFVDRFMATPMFYPANYGYIPNTLADDGDALDVLVVTPYPVAPGSVIRARPVGVLHMTDEAGGDAKLLAVPHEKLSQLYNDVRNTPTCQPCCWNRSSTSSRTIKISKKANGSRLKAGATLTQPAPRF